MAKRVIHVKPPEPVAPRKLWVNQFTVMTFALGAAVGALVTTIW